MMVLMRQDGLNRREFVCGLSVFPFWGRPGTVRFAEARFRVLRRGASSRRYLHIHGDETSAREVLLAHMKHSHGVAFLVRSQWRTVPLLGGRVDPNRMFSRAGAEANLRKLNPDWNEAKLKAALDALDRARPGFLKAVRPPAGGLLIAVHNNSSGYSVHDEVPISDLVSLKNPGHPREFLLCTDPGDFDVLRTFRWNVVLQQEAPPSDDGSLSRLAAREKFRYLNIETPRGDFARQQLLLAAIDDELR